jgi:hypothetical protein
MSNNGGWAGWREDADFAAFDALPAEIRRAFAEAPYDLAFGDIATQLTAFQESNGRRMNAREVAFAVAAIREEVGFELEATAFALYGAEHPQARVVSIECLADLKLLSVFADMRRWRSGKRAGRENARTGPKRDVAASRVGILYEYLHPRRILRGAARNNGSGSQARGPDPRNAAFDPRRDGYPEHASAAAELMGEPPIGRLAIDSINAARRP